MFSKCELNIINNDKLTFVWGSHTHPLQTCESPKGRISEHIPQEQKLSDVSQLLWEDPRIPKTGRTARHQIPKMENVHLVLIFPSQSNNGKSCLWISAGFKMKPEVMRRGGQLNSPLCIAHWVTHVNPVPSIWYPRWSYSPLKAAVRSSVAWAGARQAVPNVLVDSEQNKCGFHQKSLGQICITRSRLSLSNTGGGGGN